MSARDKIRRSDQMSDQMARSGRSLSLLPAFDRFGGNWNLTSSNFVPD